MISIIQTLFVVSSIGVEYWLFGAIGPLAPVSSFVLGTFLIYAWIGSKKQRWPQRTDIIQMARRSGFIFGALCSLGYGGAYWMAPEYFSFASYHLVWIVPMLAAAIWVGTFIVSVCVGDTVATMYDTYPRKGEHSFRMHPLDEMDRD